jgi:hypothetical protein
MTLMLLRWSEAGISRLAATRRARTDVVWRAAMGLQLGAPTPDEKTLREFEQFLRRRHPEADRSRYLVVHEHFVRLCVDEGLGAEDAVWGTDSTPMWCYGAVLDTVRLLGDGVRKLARLWAKAQKIGVLRIAQRWSLSHLISAKSTKGGLDIDWRNREARAEGLDAIARAVMGAVGDVYRGLEEVRSDKRKKLLQLGRRLLTVVAQDLEADEKGRLVIARKVAPGRLASLTDPQARHGRKSASQTYTGFKLHMLGDCVSGLIASLTVTHGSQHDATVTPRLVRRAKGLLDSFDLLLADTAYGGAQLRHELDHVAGVGVLAPPPVGGRRKPGRLAKQDFTIDLDAKTASCPNEALACTREVIWSNKYKKLVTRFLWARSDCDNCPVRAQCLGKGSRSKRLALHPYERELRQARADWTDPSVRQAYKQRSQHERLINRLTRHGARQARAFGLGNAQLQAHSIAMTVNLTLLAKQLAAKEAKLTKAAA